MSAPEIIVGAGGHGRVLADALRLEGRALAGFLDPDSALGWTGLPVLGDDDALMDWPEPGPTAETPFMLMLLRGKGYMRMEYQPPNMATLQHAAVIFTTACENALGGLSTPVRRP